MTNEEYQRRIDDAKARAHGRWPEILLHLGLEPRMIKKRANMPCPFCGGEDRFQFTDKFREGNYHCRSCGAGGGYPGGGPDGGGPVGGPDTGPAGAGGSAQRAPTKYMAPITRPKKTQP